MLISFCPLQGCLGTRRYQFPLPLHSQPGGFVNRLETGVAPDLVASLAIASTYGVVGDHACEVRFPSYAGVHIKRQTNPSIGFDAYVIIYCNSKPLLAAQVTLGRLNAHVAEKELNLLQFTAGHVTQTCASPSQIVWGQGAGIGFQSKLLDHAPDHLLRDATPPRPRRSGSRI